jgi:hypothetical protein
VLKRVLIAYIVASSACHAMRKRVYIPNGLKLPFSVSHIFEK